MSEQDEQVLEATNSNDGQDIEINLEDTEDVEALKAQVTEKDTFAKQAIARAKKAEAELKTLKESKGAEATHVTNNTAFSEQDIEAKILLAQGMDKELLEQAKILAKIRNKSILEIQNDPILLAMKKEKEEIEKAQKAKLGASKGSSQVKAEKNINSSNLSEEEHKALWKAQQGR